MLDLIRFVTVLGKKKATVPPSPYLAYLDTENGYEHGVIVGSRSPWGWRIHVYEVRGGPKEYELNLNGSNFNITIQNPDANHIRYRQSNGNAGSMEAALAAGFQVMAGSSNTTYTSSVSNQIEQQLVFENLMP